MNLAPELTIYPNSRQKFSHQTPNQTPKESLRDGKCQSHTFSLRKIGVIWPKDRIKLQLPDDIPSDADIFVEPRIENNINEWIPQIVNPVNGIIEVENYSEFPIIYGKGRIQS